MGKIAIVTDSTSDLPEEMLGKYNIKVVPLYVNFEDENYADNGIDITYRDFYEKLANVKVLPKSAQPSPADFINAYREVLKENDSIISIHISKKMSGTIDSAEMAKKEVGGDIEIIDSEMVHTPLGLMVLKAAELAGQGKSKEQIINAVNELKQKISVLFIPQTLKYLIMGGRIGRARGLIASLLEINPILTLKLGEVSQYKKTRRWNQAKNELIDSMKSMIKDSSNVIAYVTDSNAASEGDDMLERIKKEINPKAVYRSYIGSIVGIHLGPGAVAVTFYEE
ncbi:MAG: DegV family protein [Actinobacteria bacterium]|nr:DegV family protein [Actinomycetota bacterium]